MNSILNHLARPAAFDVVTRYADGTTRSHRTATLAQAKNWQTGESRKIGKQLTDRATGLTVEVTAVDILPL